MNGKSTYKEKKRDFRQDWPLGEDIRDFQWSGSISTLWISFLTCKIKGLGLNYMISFSSEIPWPCDILYALWHRKHIIHWRVFFIWWRQYRALDNKNVDFRVRESFVWIIFVVLWFLASYYNFFKSVSSCIYCRK